MKMVRVAVVGAAGYSGEELLRLLLRHPGVTVSHITSRQYAGEGVEAVFPRFAGSGLAFVKPDVEVLADAEVAFLALPHGLAAEYAAPLLERGVRVIDISADFRLRDLGQYRDYYGGAHPAPELMASAVYGAPERYREALRCARLIACPGCYPTSITLAVCPVLAAGLASPDGIVATSMSGVSGAGRKEKLPYLFAECNESIRPYGVVGHRHLPEIEQELSAAAGVPVVMSFVPHLIPVTRGIHSTILLQGQAGADGERVLSALSAAYAAEPFVRVLAPGRLADTKNVTGTNMAEIGAAFDSRTGRIILSSAIDNLTKGASGQAVQCMNIACGFDESAGLL